MSPPVFGREPSRPLPKEGESEPTGEIDLTDRRPGPRRRRNRDDPTEPMTIEPEAAEPEAAERAGVDESEAAERDGDEPEAAERDGVDEPDVAQREHAEGPEVADGPDGAEPELGEAGVAERDEADEVEEPEGTGPDAGGSEAVKTEVMPVVLDAEGVGAEPEVAPVGPDPSEQWIEIQAQFVDDPEAATDGALRMLRERLDGLVPALASTEDLRVAFQRYRAAWFDLGKK
jgi:hypothetical protein